MHGYDEWRVPTNEELSLLRANGYLSSAQYITKENASGMVLLVTTGKSVAEKEAIRAEQTRQAEIARQKEAERQAELARQREARRQELLSQGLVDLGLPSGTLWKNANEGGDNARYTYNEAVSRFGNKLPTKQQLEELKSKCTWTWTGSGYKVTGPNGNSITLPAAGIRHCDGDVGGVGGLGFYWSSTPNDSGCCPWGLEFDSSEVHMDISAPCHGQSVRLVLNL